MRIGIIGAGKVGFTLGKFFSENGIEVAGYISRSLQSAKEAAKFTNSKYYERSEELLIDSDAIFLTVPDRAISQVYCDLAKYEIRNKYVCHCSGVLSAGEAFPGIEETGAYGVSIHPLFPISSRYDAWREMPGVFFCLEGDPRAVQDFEKLLLPMGVNVRRLLPGTKTLYHTAAVFVSNLMCALEAEAVDLLGKCGFDRKSAEQALAPLLMSNAKHLAAHGVNQALTGPIERNDAGTVRKHLLAFHNPSEEGMNDMLTVYRLLSLRLKDVAFEKHPEEDFSELTALLSASEVPSEAPTGKF